MKRLGSIAFVLVLVAGCASVHTLGPDASERADASDGRDAAPRRDAGWMDPMPDAHILVDAGTDAFVCADEDGDGFAGAACGGDDCDDADPELSPVAGPCGTATALRRCVDGVAMDVECSADAPLCDARTGECALTACGDAVVHPGEDCDDGDPSELDGCDDGCRYSRCAASVYDCPLADAPYCPPGDDAGWARCSPGNPEGGANGERCTSDADCLVACDSTQGRCTESCNNPRGCAGPGVFCSVGAWELFSVAAAPPAPRCEFECSDQADCPPGASCVVLSVGLRPAIPVTSCRATPASALHGPGEPCGPDECARGFCLPNLPVGRCTEVCEDDSDCPPSLPRCEPMDLARFGLAPRPPEWGDPFVSVCSPAS